MLSSARFFFISLFVLAMGVGLSLSRPYLSDISKTKSTEDYWTETGLGPASLEDLVEDDVCGTSERYFLACANALLSVANRYNLTLTLDGKLVPARDVNEDIRSEKTQLVAWKSFFSEETSRAVRFPFQNVWAELKNRYIEPEKMSLIVGVGLNGFISIFRDPHTYLMPLAQFNEVVAKADNRSQSLGLILGLSQNNYAIRKVVSGSPAEKAGLRRGDILISIDGQALKGLMRARVSELLKGDMGTELTVQVRRGRERKNLRVLRSESTVPTVSGKVLDGIRPVGVLTLNKFAKGACSLTKQALLEMKEQGVRGLLLDLRDNPGGQMDEAACVTSLFVGPRKKIFEIRYLDPGMKGEQYFGTEEQVFDAPVAILMNASSASAAEIVAGAMRDFNRAVLVGERTFGKGSFQEGELWSQNPDIALFETKGFYYLPSGRSPQLKGLEPDVKVAADDIWTGREEDQFLHPLRAPERGVKELAESLTSTDCLRIEDQGESLDQELSKARDILFCTKPVAGAQE